jgi:Tol biopolymer transport system component
MKPLTTICTILILLAAPAAMFAQDRSQAGKLLESARHKEVMEGDLKGAIEQYRKIAGQFAKQPEIAAQALLKLGQCQEKLGQAEARKAYERIVKDYAGTGEYAAAARARLAAMSTPASGAAPRLVWDDYLDVHGTVSPDGQFFSFVDWTTGDIALRDLRKGTNRRLTDCGGPGKAQAEGNTTAISADGKNVAFVWNRWDKEARASKLTFELRTIAIDGTGERVLYRSGDYIEVHSWSPDNKWVAIVSQDKSFLSAEISLVSTNSGEVRTLKTSPKPYAYDVSISPDGQWLAYSAEPERNSGKFNLFTVKADGSVENRVAEDARSMGWTPNGKGLLFARAVDGGEGIFLLPVHEGAPAAVAKKLSVTIPGRSRPIGVTAGGALFYSTYDNRMDAWVSEVDLNERVLGKRKLQFPVTRVGLPFVSSAGLKFSPDGTQFVCAVPKQGLLLHTVATGEQRTLLPKVRPMRVDWAPDGKSLLAYGMDGAGKRGLHRLDLRTGAANFLAEVESGMQHKSGGDESGFYFTRTGDWSKIWLRDLDSGRDRIIFEVPERISDVTEIQPSRDRKRLLIRSTVYIGVLDLANGNLTDIVAFDEGPNSEQIWGADWSADERHIVAVVRPGFTARKSQVMGFPVAGGEPVRIAAPTEFRGLSMSPDGRHMASVDFWSKGQILVLENFLPKQD